MSNVLRDCLAVGVPAFARRACAVAGATRPAAMPGLLAATVAALLPGWSRDAWARPGDLDPSFGGDGRVFFDVAGDADFPATVALQPDGKVVVGRRNESASDDFSVLRFNADGSLDASFDGDGRTSLDYPGIKGTTHVVLLQPDGKIVAAGTARNTAVNEGTNFGLARYNPDGSVDPSFGVEGVVIHDLGGRNEISSIVQLADGRLVVAGSTDRGTGACDDMAFAGFTADGRLDESFGTEGEVILDFHGSNGCDRVHWLVEQPDGMLLAVGEATPSKTFTTEDMAVVRLTPDGALDPSLDEDGRAVVDLGFIGPFAGATTAAIMPDSRIVVAGWAEYDPWGYYGCDAALARLNQDGSRDLTFDTEDHSPPPGLGQCAWIEGLVLDPDHHLLLTGNHSMRATVDPDNQWYDGHYVARMTPDGSFDPDFGANGVAIVDVGDGNRVHYVSDSRQGVVLQPDGRIVTVAATITGDNRAEGSRIMVARLLANGDAPGVLGLVTYHGEVTEALGTAVVAVRRTGGSAGAVSVDYNTAGGSATSGVDFTATTGTLAWQDGDTAEKTIEIPILADTQSEGPESFTVRIARPIGGASLGNSELEVTIAGQNRSGPTVPPPTNTNPTPSSGGGGSIDWAILLLLAAMLIAPITGQSPWRVRATRLLMHRVRGPGRATADRRR